MTVLDSSAVLALVHDEPGADQVAQALPGSMLSTINLAEVVFKLIDADIDASQLQTLLTTAGVTIEPFLAGDAEFAGAMRSLPGGRALSLGDRCYLALTVCSDPPEVLTGDRIWTELDLPIRIRLFRKPPPKHHEPVQASLQSFRQSARGLGLITPRRSSHTTNTSQSTALERTTTSSWESAVR